METGSSLTNIGNDADRVNCVNFKNHPKKINQNFTYAHNYNSFSSNPLLFSDIAYDRLNKEKFLVKNPKVDKRKNGGIADRMLWSAIEFNHLRTQSLLKFERIKMASLL